MSDAHYVYCADCDEQHFIPGTEPELEEVGMTVITVDTCQCERPHHANGECGRRVEPGTEFCLGCIGGCFDD